MIMLSVMVTLTMIKMMMMTMSAVLMMIMLNIDDNDHDDDVKTMAMIELPHHLSRSPCCVLLALSWNTTNENPSTDRLSRAINYHHLGLGDNPENDDDDMILRMMSTIVNLFIISASLRKSIFSSTVLPAFKVFTATAT